MPQLQSSNTYVHNPQYPGRATLASLAGTNPASGAAEYFLHDQLGSTRALYNASRVQQGSFSYTPLGELYASTNARLATHRYTGHDFDPASPCEMTSP